MMNRFVRTAMSARPTYEAANAWLKANDARFHLVNGEPHVTALGRTVEFSLWLPHESAVVEAVLALKGLLEG